MHSPEDTQSQSQNGRSISQASNKEKVKVGQMQRDHRYLRHNSGSQLLESMEQSKQ